MDNLPDNKGNTNFKKLLSGCKGGIYINREIIMQFMRQTSYRPLSFNELKEALEVNDAEELRFTKDLGRLEKEGEIVKTRKNKYGLPEMMNLTRGVIRLNQRGYGILSPDEVGQAEIFVYGRNLNGAMQNDRVLVRIQERAHDEQRPEGEVVRVITRANTQLVGTFQKGKNMFQVIPDDPRQIYPIMVKPQKKIKVNHGDRVVVAITSWPEKFVNPEGRIVEVLGKKGQPGLELQVVIKKHALREHFPEGLIEEARAVAVEPSIQDMEGRKDLRGLRMVTIDGEDAKDLDDAVSIERTEQGYRLGVHIADVSHYVREDSKLDKEAFARGTSVYLINRVLPMLPPELSNGICSLNPQVDRLAISCIMDIDMQGKVTGYDLYKSVIHIDERMTYTAVNKILEGSDAEVMERYRNLTEDFKLMKELADILRAERYNRGALDFDFPETKVLVDDDGFPVDIIRFERGPAEMLIEDFMIKANEVVSEHLYWQEMPCLYRVHEKPEDDAIGKLNMVLGVFGHKITAKKIEPLVLQKLLQDVKGRPEEQLISIVVLRSMKHARYLPQPLGHFGLASKYYSHFTSPIRRYPDLAVHRVLSLLLEGNMTARKRTALEKKMGMYAENSSVQEVKAEEAERELVDIKKAQYMEKFIGDVFTARISSVLAFGFFVELENTVEGLVHISSIYDDYYVFNERNYTLTGNHSGRKFSMGDEVQVQLVKVSVQDARIDFELVR